MREGRNEGTNGFFFVELFLNIVEKKPVFLSECTRMYKVVLRTSTCI